MAKRKFEARIINPILNAIVKNLDYLTQPGNLGQLAKLGFIYEKLWYAGRYSFGYEGKIKSGYECENNPKYKLEMCDVGTEEQYDLVYDAWGMHISEGWEIPESFEGFRDLILNGKTYSELELKMLKPQKTLDEWVEIKTDPEYRYKSLYPNRKSVINNLLCTIGTGYGYSKGFIIEQASGADQDRTLYGKWENAELEPGIQKMVDKVLEDLEVELVIETRRQGYLEYQEKEKQKRGQEHRDLIEQIKSAQSDSTLNDYDDLEGLIEAIRNRRNSDPSVKKEEEYRNYYPICEYSNITKLNKDSDPSYILGAIEICRDILDHIEEEKSQRHPNGNVEYAQEFLQKDFVKQYL